MFNGQPLDAASFVYQNKDCSKTAYITAGDSTGIQRCYTLKYGQTLAKRMERSAWTDDYRVISVMSLAGREYWLRENSDNHSVPTGVLISNGYTVKDVFIQNTAVQVGDPVLRFTSAFGDGFAA